MFRTFIRISLLTGILLAAISGLWAADDPFASILGDWQGSLNVGPKTLLIVLHVTKGADGKLAGTLDSPDQGAGGLLIDSVVFTDGTLDFTINAVRGHFIGSLSDDGKMLEGQWTQGGENHPLSFKRAKDIAAERPQAPKKPYPYNEEEVTFKNEKAKITFAGTLTWPKNTAPCPAVLLIPGNEPQDRNETMFGHQPFLVLADYLTRRGFAVLRVDDRGVGGSTGDKTKATIEDMAADILSGIAYLKTRKEINPAKVGLLCRGGGGFATISAAQDNAVAFVILLACPALPGDEVAVQQVELSMKAKGVPQEAIAEQTKMLKRIFGIVKNAKDTADAEKQLWGIVDEQLAQIPEANRPKRADIEPMVKQQFAPLLSPTMHSLLNYDPIPSLKKMTMPVLALIGEKDTEMSPKQNLANLEKAVKDGGNKDVTALQIPNLNHLLQRCTSGASDEYSRLDETFSPIAMQIIGDWISEHIAQAKK